jgi:ubiquinone/menaquinone biosynthesis C-methylase UbiE
VGENPVTTPEDYRQVSAKYYDEAYATKEDLDDLKFYVDMAKANAKTNGRPVLELACGTGRILLPIARQGIPIHGIDSSQPMLNVLRDKLTHELKDVQELVSVSHGDIRNFRSNREYPLVIIPFRPLQHMYTVEDQVAALQTAAFHLEAGGSLVFDVFYPRFDSINSKVGEELLELEWTPKSDSSKVIRRYFRKESVDKINQTFTAIFIFRTYQGERLVQEETESLKMSYYTYPHLRALFLFTGLEIVEEYGSFERTPLDNQAEQMIFVLQKSSY